MAAFIKKRKHLYTRIPLGLFVILFVAVSPVIMSMIGAVITEWSTGAPCHEGNCFWGAFGWLAFVTIPIGALLFLIFVGIVIRDIYQMNR